MVLELSDWAGGMFFFPFFLFGEVGLRQAIVFEELSDGQKVA